MQEIIVTTKEELREIVDSSVRRVLTAIMQQEDDKLITSKEAMDMLGIKSPHTLKKIARSGAIDRKFPSGSTRPRYSRKQIKEYIYNNNV